MKILILTASTGNGHTSAANAIREVAETQGVKSPVVDVMDHCPKAFRRWFKNGYEMLVRRSPEMWGYLYRKSDKPHAEYWIQTFLDETCAGPIQNLLRSDRPEWVVCTHSLPQPRLKRLRHRFGFKMAVVVTDLYPHRMWLRGRPDLYFVPGEWSKEILEQRLPHARGRTVVTGIPITKPFAEPIGRAEARVELGMEPDERMVFLNSGGIGGGPVVETAECLSRLGVKVVVVCGRHEVNFRRLTGLHLPNVTVKGHVTPQEMAVLMQACDVMVAKAGGLTTCEALSTGTPFVVHMPLLIPGQEEGNAQFLEESGAGFRTHSDAELLEKVGLLLRDAGVREAMSAKAKSLAQPKAAETIVSELLARSRTPIAR